MSYSDKPQIVTLSKGQSCTGHMMPIGKAVMFEDIPPAELDKAPDATDALTIRYREDVSKGDMIEYGGEQREVLSVFDPYAREDEEQTEIVRASRVRPTEVKPKRPSQARKFLKCLVKKV